MQPKTLLAVDIAFAVFFTAIFVATVFWPDWIELVFGANPDGGNGQSEWTIVATSGLLAVASIIVARIRWRRWRQQHPVAGAITRD
jgi:hypothetical protein